MVFSATGKETHTTLQSLTTGERSTLRLFFSGSSASCSTSTSGKLPGIKNPMHRRCGLYQYLDTAYVATVRCVRKKEIRYFLNFLAHTKKQR